MREAALLSVLVLGAIETPLDPRAIAEALAVANSSLESTHRRFHADYRFPAGTPPVDFVSVVSPFRRLVLAAETALRDGRRMFGQREALAALQPDPDRLEIFVELTFHPHNTFVGVPDYGVRLEPRLTRRGAVLPRHVDRFPRFGARVEDPWYPLPYPYTGGPVVPGGSEPLTGGTLVAQFSATEVDARGDYDVTVVDDARILARVRVDFARIR